jgi:hypothetical protein
VSDGRKIEGGPAADELSAAIGAKTLREAGPEPKPPVCVMSGLSTSGELAGRKMFPDDRGGGPSSAAAGAESTAAEEAGENTLGSPSPSSVWKRGST